MHEMLRRTVLGGAIAGAALLQGRSFAQSGQKVIPWSDQPPPVPPPLANWPRESRAGRTWTRGSHRMTNGSALPTMIVRLSTPRHGIWTCPGRSATLPQLRWTS